MRGGLTFGLGWLGGKASCLEGLQWVTRSKSLPRLAVSPVLGAFPFVIRERGAVSSWDPEFWLGFKRPIQVSEFSQSGRHTQVSHLRRVGSA